MREETWKPVPGYIGYDVSDRGRVRSYRAGVNGRLGIVSTPQRILQPSRNSRGYLTVSLYIDGNQRTHHIGPLVLATFMGPRPGGLEVCHRDGDKENNHLDNLRYDTAVANEADKPESARMAMGQKLTDVQAIIIRERYAAGGITQKQLGEEYGVHYSNIGRLCNGYHFRHLGGPRTNTRIRTVVVS